MDPETLEAIRTVMREELKPINTKLSDIDNRLNNLEEGQQKIKDLVADLDPRNANRHIEIVGKVDGVANKVELLRQDMNKVEVVTSQNSYEIQYLKAVK